MRTTTIIASLRRHVASHLAALLLASPTAALAEALPALGADTQAVTVSGVSSGGYMAVQFHIAHSSTVDGAGVLAGGPYECAAGSTWFALTRCMAPTWWSSLPSVEVFRQRTLRRAQSGDIDPLAGLAGDRAWVFSGGRDKTVEQPVVDSLVELYRTWLPSGQPLFVTRPDAGHAMISTEEPEPNGCASSEPPFINRCGDFDAAGELLAHLLGALAPKQEPPAERVRPFDQQPFLDKNAAASGMADEGYVFFPEELRVGRMSGSRRLPWLPADHPADWPALCGELRLHRVGTEQPADRAVSADRAALWLDWRPVVGLQSARLLGLVGLYRR